VIHASSARPVTTAVILGLCMAPSLARAQEQSFALAAPTASFAHPFTKVAGLAELPDGRSIVADSRERLIHLVDRTGTKVTSLGTQGEGPLEFRSPFGVNRWPGDTIAIYDAGNRRYLKVSPEGRIFAELPIPVAFIMRGGFAPPRGIDAAGRIYWLGDVVDMQPVIKRRVSQNLRRWAPPAERLDTVAAAADHASEMHAHKFHPFAQRDAVVIAPDGRVGVLSARDYRLRWFRDGKLAAEGPVLAHEPVPVSAADRKAYREERAANVGRSSMSGPAGTAPSAAARRTIEDAYPDALFPLVKPPFIENGATISPAGDVWVTRSGSPAERRARIDVLAPDGTRKGHLLLPEARRLVSLERGGVYLARTDEDGFEWIERYAWPAGLR
jgi:hypothetical protein